MVHVRTYSGDMGQYVPSIALHSSDNHQSHQRPMPPHIQTDLLIPSGAHSGPSSAVVQSGGSDPFTLSPVDMSASPLAGSIMSAHSTSHSHSGGPSPDAMASMHANQFGSMHGHGMAKASHSVPVPMPNHFNPNINPQLQAQPQHFLDVPQHYGQGGHVGAGEANSGNASGGDIGVNGAGEGDDDMAWLDLGIDPALQAPAQGDVGFMGSYGAS